jgi:hypothetical protein
MRSVADLESRKVASANRCDHVGLQTNYPVEAILQSIFNNLQPCACRMQAIQSSDAERSGAPLDVAE